LNTTFINKCIEEFNRKKTFELSTQFTLLTLLFSQVGNAYTRPFILSLAAIGLLSDQCRKQSILWFSLFLLTGFRVIDQWPMADNHAYLLSLWCLTLFLTTYRETSSTILANNARILIGLIFLLASFQKINAEDYLNGTFFRYLFLTDDRFEGFAILFGNISYQQIDDARRLLDAYQFSPTQSHGEIVPISAEFHLLVVIATWWNVLDQIVIACCFLSPTNSLLFKNRDFVLLVFCITTYAVAPVPGFAWLLISMALAQSESKSRIVIAYLITFFIVLFYYQIHWTTLLVDFFQLG